MVNIHARLKRMGNSLGIIVPAGIVNKQRLKEGDELIIEIESGNKTTVADMFREAKKQKLRFNTEEILDELDRELE